MKVESERIIHCRQEVRIAVNRLRRPSAGQRLARHAAGMCRAIPGGAARSKQVGCRRPRPIMPPVQRRGLLDGCNRTQSFMWWTL